MKVNLDKNKKYYSKTDLEICDCNFCEIYKNKIKKLYPNINRFLDKFNIDISKPFELTYFEYEDRVEYYCQYVCFGNCSNDFSFKIDDIEFTKNIDSHPDTKIKEEHFVLEFGKVIIQINK